MGKNDKTRMLNLFDQTQVYFAVAPIDMRKQIDGIALCVQEVLSLDPYSRALFAFCNRQRDKVKVLYWHSNGFCLLYKRMEKGRFVWPKGAGGTVHFSVRELHWLLEGLSLDDLAGVEKVHFAKV